jgi:pimeloyl-ACP methyl ester carboxylesterase
MLKNPKKYFSIINWLNKKKLLNKSLHKIATYYLGNAESRKLLALVWPAMSQLIPDIAKVRKAIAEHNIRVHVFSGLHDRLIPPSRAEHLAPGLPQVTLHILDKGHRLYDSSNAAEIAQYLLPR